jgi:uncharacterized protein YraI
MIVVALAVAASPLVSTAAFAQSALNPGAVALVANTGGELVLLRETPSFDAAVLSAFPEGTPADVLEGPVYSADGVAWVGVSVGGMTGYLVAGYLVESGQAASAPETVELAQEAVPTETMAADAAPAAAAPVPAAAASGLPANPAPTADLNLRAGPSYDDAILLVIPAGAPLTPTGESAAGFVGVTYQGQYGWVDSSWLAADETAPTDVALLQEAAPAAAPQAAPVADAGLVGDLSTAPAGDVAYAASTVNLRLGPSETDDVLRVLPAGGAVTITGPASDGWIPVWYNGTWGFISSDFLTSDGSASLNLFQEAAPAAEPQAAVDPALDGGTADMQALTTSDVNLRAAPDTASAVLGAIPPGVALTPLAGPEQGFYQVEYNGQTGWVSADYVEVTADLLQRGSRESRQDEGKVEGSEPAANAELGAGGIIWPVSGGLWYIMQGYHGSSHQNQDSLWQYEYSLDLARRDGDTAGQQVISPVNGVVRWTDPSTGGISIDIGNGHAVAMFHVDFMAGLEAGANVRQGQYLGAISGPGGPGFAGTPHLHFTLWSSSDNGNWDRQAVPFTGQYAISGMDFPDSGGGNTFGGTEFQP